jgi:hypothetical protein
MSKPTKKQVEAAAYAVIKIMPPPQDGTGAWGADFIAKAKWPKDFYPMERKFARRIATAALNAAYK